MIYLDFPLGTNFGWGVCGKYICRELADITDVTLLRTPADLAGIDELDAHFLKTKLAHPDMLALIKDGIINTVDFPVLQASTYTFPSWQKLNWCVTKPRGAMHVQYMFFDEMWFDPAYIKFMDDSWDLVIAGSKWCEFVLNQNGFNKTTAIIQGIDPQIFNPTFNEKQYFKDRFVIFSGGKFELRKGQDIVVKAYKVLQQKYKDVMLVNAWYNHWLHSLVSMRNSPHIKFEPRTKDCMQIINQILVDEGIDMDRVISLPVHTNPMMARIYKNTDIGLFTNRWEGGTNLVLMEYMATGKPVIGSFNSGHTDILTEQNSLMIKTMTPKVIQVNNTPVAQWYESDLDETIAHLEWAYHNRDKLEPLGQQAGIDMGKQTWTKVAQDFYEVLKPALN